MLDFSAFAPMPLIVLLNVLLAIRHSGRRWLHILLVVGAVGVEAFAWWSTERHVANRHRWFLGRALATYERMANEIVSRSGALTAKGQLIESLNDNGQLGLYAGRVYGQTNQDGSVTLWFHRKDVMRSGFLYHSGNVLTNCPGDPKGYFFHLTNSWYEF